MENHAEKTDYSEENFNNESSVFISKNKRKVEEIENDNENEWVKNKFSKGEGSADSDNEDDSENGNEENYALSQDDIEGQEETGIRQDGDVPITPFNVIEEMEEGHFDADGNYHWTKEKLIKDNWLDNCDFIKIKPQNPENVVNESDSELDEMELFDPLPIYKEMLRYMIDGETVNNALKRHGGKKSLSASERLKLKKSGVEIPKTNANNDASSIIVKLTGLADKILCTGNLNVYEYTFERITKLIEKIERGKQGIDIHDTTNDLDMYADDFDSREKARINNSESDDKNADDDEKSDDIDDETRWEYKIDKDSDKVEGPFSTTDMIKWKDEDYFKQRVWVRKYNSEGEFYSIDRIDFELYV